MSRSGSHRERDGRHYVRVRYGDNERVERRLQGVASTAVAEERVRWIAGLVDVLVAAKLTSYVEKVVDEAAMATNEKARRTVERLVAGFCDRTLIAPATGMTVKELGQKWTSGDLAREYPDKIRTKRSATDDRERLEKYVYPHVGRVRVATFRLEDAELVMRQIPTSKSAGTRRQVAQLLSRMMKMAVYPLKLRLASPLPEGFLPRTSGTKAKSFLYPTEEAKLLGNAAIPDVERLVYGILAREGMRLGELVATEWTDFDLARGAINLDRNKTDDPRAWALRPDTARALRLWKERTQRTSPFAGFETDHAADRFRARLVASGVDRPELVERTDARLPIRVHDLRATFVTLSLAAGKTETWVADRTGHKSSAMINRYRRAARTAAELALGDLGDLPTLLGWVGDRMGDDSGGVGGDAMEYDPSNSAESPEVPKEGLEPSRGVTPADFESPLATPGNSDRPDSPSDRDGSSRVERLIPHASPGLREVAVGVAGLLCACDVLELGMAQLEALDGPEGES